MTLLSARHLQSSVSLNQLQSSRGAGSDNPAAQSVECGIPHASPSPAADAGCHRQTVRHPDPHTVHGNIHKTCNTTTKKMGGWWRWALVSPDGAAPSRMVSVFATCVSLAP